MHHQQAAARCRGRNTEDGHELRKAAIISLRAREVPTMPVRIVLEYMVPGARWAPSYAVSLTKDLTSATVSVRAAVAQSTGEDWAGVKLTLATADAQRWTELPELQALRIGRRQPQPSKRGWRAPPIGAGELYALRPVPPQHLDGRDEGGATRRAAGHAGRRRRDARHARARRGRRAPDRRPRPARTGQEVVRGGAGRRDDAHARGQRAAPAVAGERGAGRPAAPYRKEATGGLDDTQLRALEERLTYLREMEDRRAAILKSIEEQGKLTDALRDEIAHADTKARLEDLYLPYKPRRRTKAQIAREAGIGPLAEALLGDATLTPEVEAEKYLNAEAGFAAAKAVLDGARQILMEHFAEDAALLGELRAYLHEHGQVRSSVIEGKENEGANFRDWFEASHPGESSLWSSIAPH